MISRQRAHSGETLKRLEPCGDAAVTFGLSVTRNAVDPIGLSYTELK